MIKNLFLTLCLTLSPYALGKLSVVFMTPELKGDSFWDLTVSIAQKAANDLDIHLSIVKGENHRFINQQLLSQTVKSRNNIDYFIFMPQTGKSLDSFRFLNGQGIKFVTLERDFNEKELKSIGQPTKVFENWIGEVYYDDVAAGRLLAQSLLEQVNLSLQAPSIIAISGAHDVISKNREFGLISALSKDSQLKQIIKTNWDPEMASRRISKLVARYPEANIIWAASDDIILAALSKLGSSKAKQFKSGGIDLTAEALLAIEKGGLDVTVGGHFMQAAWALVQIYDHQKQLESFKVQTPLLPEVVNQKNVGAYKRFVVNRKWHDIDFKRFTLHHSKQKQYDFSLKKLISSQ